MNSRSIDHRPPVETALVLHPVRSSGHGSGQTQTPRDPGLRLDEAVGLAQALDLEIKGAELVPIRAPAPATLFGKGKVAEIGERCAAEGVDVVVVDDALTPIQQRNLERAWKVKVIDRTGLILEIFGRRARTREGRLQVELARLAYERSRLVKTWTHLERQRGGLGAMSGPGETQIETDRRLLTARVAKLKRELAEVRRTRRLQRDARRRAPHPTIALVGYTNAGKSTLFNRLTEAKVEARDMLFATLDPTVRALRLPDGRPAMLSDTVGFISDLPHELVEAFRATLEAVREADVIVHVRDIAGEDSEAQAEDVRKVLAELDAGAEAGQVLIEAWNKIDLLPAEDQGVLMARARRVRTGEPAAFPISAVTGAGTAALLRGLAERIDSGEPVEAMLGAGDGQAMAWLYRHGRILTREDEDDGVVRLSVRLDGPALGRFERLFPDALVRAAAE
ncbi:MAG TPA: GTPase HflX [Caulobacteraceae bacterium]|nr:GTPase HflX [Caulobacteraceae bacterium]